MIKEKKSNLMCRILHKKFKGYLLKASNYVFLEDELCKRYKTRIFLRYLRQKKTLLVMIDVYKGLCRVVDHSNILLINMIPVYHFYILIRRTIQ